MPIDRTASGLPSAAHVSLREAGALRHGQAVTFSLTDAGRPPSTAPGPAVPARSAAAAAAVRQPAAAVSAPFEPHTPVTSASNDPAEANRWDAMLNRVGKKYNVPPVFLKAVMLSESAGRPDAIGDGGHSVGLFQLHDHGYGAGMGDTRFDPEVNADRAAKGLAEAWHAGESAGFTGEYAVRAAYNYSFNPGGGWAYQGDSVVKNYNRLLAAQGVPPLPPGTVS
jgi:hypothetical protein